MREKIFSLRYTVPLFADGSRSFQAGLHHTKWTVAVFRYDMPLASIVSVCFATRHEARFFYWRQKEPVPRANDSSRPKRSSGKITSNIRPCSFCRSRTTLQWVVLCGGSHACAGNWHEGRSLPHDAHGFQLIRHTRNLLPTGYCPAVPIALLTEREWRPLALLEARTLRPFFVDILCRKPCLFLLFLFRGWYVLFIA